MENSTLNPIETLARLSAQRTARTDRLHSAVRALLDGLESAGVRTRDGLCVTADGWTLEYCERRSNVGGRNCWSWHDGDGDGCSDLALPVDHDGYLHGDFGARMIGPARAHLIAFGLRAERVVAGILHTAGAEVANLDTAIDHVSAAGIE